MIRRHLSSVSPSVAFEHVMPTEREIRTLADFVGNSRNLLCITGAGVSTSSGLPDYRGINGNASSRQRYWSRSMIGWTKVNTVLPNDAHKAIAALEKSGPLKMLITQNVDRLHQKGGSQNVIDLHGRIDEIICLQCADVSSRASLQDRLVAANPDFMSKFGANGHDQAMRADGDVDLGNFDLSHFKVPTCQCCGGVLKPHFVFFGDSVPLTRVERAYEGVDAADALLVVGTSLEVFSAYRFVLRMSNKGMPIAIVNHGETRAERAALPVQFKSDAHCSTLLREVASRI